MTVKQILTPLIVEELNKHQKSGRRVRLRSAYKKRLKYTIFCGLGALVFLPLALVIYIVLMAKLNNIDVILAEAQRSPDTPIEEIVAREVKA